MVIVSKKKIPYAMGYQIVLTIATNLIAVRIENVGLFNSSFLLYFVILARVFFTPLELLNLRLWKLELQHN